MKTRSKGGDCRAREEALQALEASAPVGAEHQTQRALWMLRLLVKAPARSRPPAVLDDGDLLQMLGLASENLGKLSARRLRRRLQQRLEGLQRAALVADSIEQNAGWLARWLGLSEAQRKVLAFAATVEASSSFAACLKPFGPLSGGPLFQLLADVLGESVEAVRASLSPQSQLVRSGLLQFRPGRDSRYATWIGLESPFDEVLAGHYERAEELFSAVCPRASEPQLPLDDFAHLARELELLVPLLRGASAERSPGVNVLMQGPPGSGKSQLVRSIARALRLPLHQVPDVDPSGQPLEGIARIAALNTMQELLRGGTPALVLFDELEDAFPWATLGGWVLQGSGSEKARTNRLLEENAVPCLWVGNRTGQLDPAFLRRFSLVVEVPGPPRAVRDGMLARYAQGLDVPLELRRKLAEHSWVMPADAARAACVTRLVQRGAPREAAEAERVEGGSAPARVLSDAEVFERALCGGRRRGAELPSWNGLAYDPALVNTSLSLARLSCGLKQRGEGQVCLYGPPGTGKTAFARQLADALERPLLYRSAGDLLDKYVGGTERATSEMFEEASRSDCVLLLDEAEGLLRARGCATRSYEITQVNELLVRMEAFRGIFLCATNSFEALDPASLRRFAVRVEFLPLDDAQRLTLLQRTAQRLSVEVHQDSAPAVRSRLARLTHLTPGDYASVLRGRQLLGEASLEALLRDLERAHAEKRSERQLGFRGAAPSL